MKVYELLADSNNWTRDAFALDSVDRAVDPKSPRACCWCLLGAVLKCYPDKDIQKQAYDKLLSVIVNTTTLRLYKGITHFNDCATHSEVLKVAQEADV